MGRNDIGRRLLLFALSLSMLAFGGLGILAAQLYVVENASESSSAKETRLRVPSPAFLARLDKAIHLRAPQEKPNLDENP